MAGEEAVAPAVCIRCGDCFVWVGPAPSSSAMRLARATNSRANATIAVLLAFPPARLVGFRLQRQDKENQDQLLHNLNPFAPVLVHQRFRSPIRRIEWEHA